MSPQNITCGLPTLTVTSSSSQSKFVRVSGEYLDMAVLSNDTKTEFVGVADNSILPKVIDVLTGTREALLVDAVNNRTRERNYYRLYSQLLENQISDEDFDREIDERPDDYVVPITKTPSETEFYQAMQLSEHIKDADTIGNIESLFSFKENAVSGYCKRLTDGTI